MEREDGYLLSVSPSKALKKFVPTTAPSGNNQLTSVHKRVSIACTPSRKTRAVLLTSSTCRATCLQILSLLCAGVNLSAMPSVCKCGVCDVCVDLCVDVYVCESGVCVDVSCLCQAV